MRYPTRIINWSRRSVATPVSLDRVVGGRYGDAGPIAELLIEGENAWRADRFAPVRRDVDVEHSTLVVDELMLTREDEQHYREVWGER